MKLAHLPLGAACVGVGLAGLGLLIAAVQFRRAVDRWCYG